MKKFSIRNIHSPKAIKPRLFDFFITDNGEPYLEIKIKKSLECISLKDVIDQIKQAMAKK